MRQNSSRRSTRPSCKNLIAPWCGCRTAWAPRTIWTFIASRLGAHFEKHFLKQPTPKAAAALADHAGAHAAAKEAVHRGGGDDLGVVSRGSRPGRIQATDPLSAQFVTPAIAGLRRRSSRFFQHKARHMSKSKKEAKLYLGIDVGGTKTLAALVQSSGKILARRRARLHAGPPRKPWPRCTTIHELIAEKRRRRDVLRGIGIAVPGIIGPDGEIVVTPNLNLSGFDMRPRLEREFGLPVALGNDVNLGTLGEQWLGAAAFADSAVGIFVGTGIGGGIIFDGKLVHGAPRRGGRSRPHADAARWPAVRLRRPRLPGIAGQPHGHRARHSRRGRQGRQTRLTEMAQGDLSVIRSNVLKKALVEGRPAGPRGGQPGRGNPRRRLSAAASAAWTPK